MAGSVYLTSVGSGGGKSTVALGLAELLSRQVGRIGIFRPLVRGNSPDPILALLSERYRVDLPIEDLSGTTYTEATEMVAEGNGNSSSPASSNGTARWSAATRLWSWSAATSPTAATGVRVPAN